MKKELLPDFAKPYKTKGYDVRLVRGTYQLFKISSKRVPDKSYPVLVQTYVGTITPENGLVPKKVTTDTASSFVEYGLSQFIIVHYKRELQRSLFNNSGSIQLVYMGIVKFMYGHTEQRFIDLTYLKTKIKPSPELDGESAAKRIAKIANKIAALFKQDISHASDRDYLIAALKDIKVDTSCKKPSVSYSDEVKLIFDRYGIKYE